MTSIRQAKPPSRVAKSPAGAVPATKARLPKEKVATGTKSPALPSHPRVRSNRSIPNRRVAPSWSPAERVSFVTSLVGVRGLAAMLDVSPSQPSRWSTGEEVPSAALARQVVDIDHVLALLVQLYAPEVASLWLVTPNAHLDSATPIDVLRHRGSTEVVSAIRAELAGAYD